MLALELTVAFLSTLYQVTIIGSLDMCVCAYMYVRMYVHMLHMCISVRECMSNL